MKSRIILTILIIFSYYPLLAQKNNIEIGLGGYNFLNVIDQPNNSFNTINVRYTWIIDTKIGVYANYIKAPIRSRVLTLEHYIMAKEALGKIEHRESFNYLDVGINYNLYKYKNHHLKAHTSLSVAYGKNQYLTHVVWTEPDPNSWEPNGHPIFAEYDDKMEGYFGGVIGLAYDYALWKDRLYMGLNLSSRYYLNNFPFQFNYGLHMGYKF